MRNLISLFTLMALIMASVVAFAGDTRNLYPSQMAVDAACGRRIVVDEARSQINGNRGDSMWWNVVAPRLSSLTSSTGKVAVVIGPQDIPFVALVQDFALDSGRYESSTLGNIERGLWLAPTHTAKLLGTADIVYSSSDFGVDGRKGGAQINTRKATAIAHFTVPVTDIRTGRVKTYEATAKAERTDVAISGYNVNGGASMAFGQSGFEIELLYEAGQKAIDDIVAQIDADTPAYVVPVRPGVEEPIIIETTQVQPSVIHHEPITSPASAIAPTGLTGKVTVIFGTGRGQGEICIPEAKPIWVDTTCPVEIWFWHCDTNGQQVVVGKFQVVAIKDRLVGLYRIEGCDPEGSDNFAVIYPPKK